MRNKSNKHNAELRGTALCIISLDGPNIFTIRTINQSQIKRQKRFNISALVEYLVLQTALDKTREYRTQNLRRSSIQAKGGNKARPLTRDVIFFSCFSKNCVGRHSGHLLMIYRYALVIQGIVDCFSKKKSGLPTCVIYQCKYSKRFYHKKITSPNQYIYKQLRFHLS